MTTIVAVQKCTPASFWLYKPFVWNSLGASQYAIPKIMNPFQPSVPPCTWATVQSV